MAGYLSDHHDDPHGRIRVLYFMASDFREMGCPIFNLRRRHFALWPVSNQNGLDLFSAKRQVNGI